MEKHLVLIKNNVLNKIDDIYEIKEKIESPDEEMIVKVTKQKYPKLYSAFREMRREVSRISFLKNSKFPDAIFLAKDLKGNFTSHICEMKRTPAHNLQNLSEQLFSGYMHCKLLLTALNVELNKINYHYHVFFIKDRNAELEFNRLPNQPKKMIPGRRLENETLYDAWLNNRLYFKESDLKFDMNIEKHRYNTKVQNRYQFDLIL